MRECFLELISLGSRVKVELDLSIYETKIDLKNTTCVDTSQPAKKFDLASLKSELKSYILINYKKYQLIQTV